MSAPETITGQFLQIVANNPHKVALLERQSDGRWASQSFKEWDERARAIAAALMEDGLAPGDSASIFSFSRREWVEADIGILMTGARTATIYQNLEGDTVHHIIKDARVKVLFVEGPVQLRALFGHDGKADVCPCLTRIVYFQSLQRPPHRPGRPEPPELTIAETVPESRRHMLVSLEEYVRRGRDLLATRHADLEKRIRAIRSDDVAKIVYTSGTTGIPKGALLSHGSLTRVTRNVEQTLGIRAGDTTLLFLPLAHVYAQLLYHVQLRIGFSVAFARSMLTALDDAQSIHPDFFISVPRLFEKIHAGVLAQVEKGGLVKKGIFQWAVDVGNRVSRAIQRGERIPSVLSAQYRLAEQLVFSKLRNRLGGRVRFMISGGAPIEKSILEFFHAAGLLIVEGYGMTENSSLTHHNRIAQFRFGTVGLPLADTETIIADDGEILVRGPGVMKGYLNLEKETTDAIDEGGWLHTGDIGVIDPDGFLRITDRKKDIIVTSGGKNIAPSPIEALLVQTRFISQAVVFGNSRQYLTALVTLDAEATEQWAKDNNVSDINLSECHEIRKAIEAEISTLNQRLQRFETIKQFAIAPREFTIADGEVTPSLKLRRKVIEERYGHLIEKLYRE